MKSTSKLSKGIFTILLGLTVVVFTSQAMAQGDTWETKASMPTAPFDPRAGVIDGLLYVVGGGTARISATFQVYDPDSDTWDTTKRLPPTRRTGSAAAVIDGELYVAGGCINGDCRIGITNKLEVYDPDTDMWTTLAPMPTARGLVAAAVIAGKLHVVGGNVTCGACIPLSTHEVYDPVLDTWQTKASMPVAVNIPAAVAIGGLLYVVGGLDVTRLDTLQVYDPGSNTWTTKTPMPTARFSLAAGVINGQIHAVGGSGDNVPVVGPPPLDDLEVYDPATDTWETRTPMPTPRGGLAAGVINDQLYAAGGSGLATLEVYTPPIVEIPVALDIKPQSCPNPLNVKSKGVLPVAILGTQDFDVTEVDPASVRLAGVAPVRSSLEDVATPFDPSLASGDCSDCTTQGADGFTDLTLKFDTQEVVSAIGPVTDGECLVVTLTGNLKEEFGGTAIAGEDVVVILKKGKK